MERLARCPACLVFDDSRGGKPSGSGPVFGGRAASAPCAVAAEQPSPVPRALPRRLGQVGLGALPRRPSGLREVDRVLGQGEDGAVGLVAGQVVLLGGSPGVGKSTLLAQLLDGLTANGGRALYVNGEESEAQIASRVRRLGLEGLLDRVDVLGTHALEDVEVSLRGGGYLVAVVDSVQTQRASDVSSAAGSPSQLKAVTDRLTGCAKASGTVLLLVGQATKDGQLAGPQAAAHAVDTLLWMERDRADAYRTLRASKNRFGSESELAVLEMHGRGLREVEDPSARFVAGRGAVLPGSCWTIVAEHDRPLAMELQTLVAPSGSGRQVATGLDASRVGLLVATLERAGLALRGEVFVDFYGVRATERACDLPLVLALASSALERPLGELVAFGELTLTGQLRASQRVEARVREAARLGFTEVLLPGTGRDEMSSQLESYGLRLRSVSSLAEALGVAFSEE